MMKHILLAGWLTAMATSAYAEKADPVQEKLRTDIEQARKEVETLRRFRAEKADQLESAETARWQERYRQENLIKEHEEKARALESRYSRTTTDLGRLNDELVSQRDAVRQMEQKLSDSKAAGEASRQLFQQTIEKAATDLAGDIPLGIEIRTAELGSARVALDGDRPQIGKAVQLFFADQEKRLALGTTQDFLFRNGQLGATPDVPLYRLRFGTVAVFEMERSGTRTQSLLRTGSLDGRTWEWRDDLATGYANQVQASILQAQSGKASAMIPLDILQSKAVRQATASGPELTWKEQAWKWFQDGGVVMYPIVLVALLALLLSLERWIFYIRRGRVDTRFLAKISDLVGKRDWRSARDLCAQQPNSLGFALHAVLNHAEADRESAEKGLREAFLRELPTLEKRLGLIAALGASAPLLGLLGTVSGMITLFHIITDVGTNDARVLAGGIAEALITTEAGLIIAIPVLLLHGYLSERLDHINSTLNLESMTILNRIWPGNTNKA